MIEGFLIIGLTVAVVFLLIWLFVFISKTIVQFESEMREYLFETNFELRKVFAFPIWLLLGILTLCLYAFVIIMSIVLLRDIVSILSKSK